MIYKARYLINVETMKIINENTEYLWVSDSAFQSLMDRFDGKTTSNPAERFFYVMVEADE